MLISKCRLCNSSKIKKIIDLGMHPLADTFLSKEVLSEPEESYPLQLALCESCGHISTMYMVSAADRYQKHEYSYDSSNSKVSIEHFKEFAQSVLHGNTIKTNDLIVDVGSNVGTLLSHFNDFGYKNVLGVEPSKNICDLANENGVRTLNNFFNMDVVDQIGGENSVKVLLSSNVVNHADDLNSLLLTAKKLLTLDGIFVFEVPYLLDLVKSVAFDTIYHEHVHYYGIKSLLSILESHGFSISKIEKIDYMCGSIRVFVEIGGESSIECSQMIKIEEKLGLYKTDTYDLFMSYVKKIKINTISKLIRIKSTGGSIVGIGAATKGNTFLNYCNIDSDIVTYISDASSLKVGKFTPGSRIPIIHDKDLEEKSFTHALILPWNIAPMLQEKLKYLNLEFYIPQSQVNLFNKLKD